MESKDKDKPFYDNRNLPDWPSSFGLAPILKEGTTVCSFCRFLPEDCVCGQCNPIKPKE